MFGNRRSNSGNQSRGYRRGGRFSPRSRFDYNVNFQEPDFAGYEEPSWRSRMPQGEALDGNLLKAYRENLKCVGVYSEDMNRDFHNDKSSIRFVKPEFIPDNELKVKRVNFDLNVGFSAANNYACTRDQEFCNLLSWLSVNKVAVNEQIEETKFVCVSKIFSKILHSSHDVRDPVEFYATSRNNVMYLKNIIQDCSGNPAFISKYGHKFEQYMVGEDVNQGIVPNIDFRPVLASSLGPYKLLMSTAIDCVDPNMSDGCEMRDLSACIHVATSFVNIASESGLNLCNKYIYWALKMAITGIKKVIIGERDRSARVKLLRLFTEDDLLNSQNELLIRCFNHALKILTSVKQKTEAKPGAVFCFTKKISRKEYTSCEVEDDFFPEWFTREMKK